MYFHHANLAKRKEWSSILEYSLTTCGLLLQLRTNLSVEPVQPVKFNSTKEKKCTTKIKRPVLQYKES